MWSGAARRVAIFVVMGLIWALGAEEQEPAHDVPKKWKYPHSVRGGIMSPSNYQDSGMCGLCHAGFYNDWYESRHGQSWRNTNFQVFYKLDLDKTGKKWNEECLKCHAPLAVLDKRFAVDEDLYKQGVSCDFCHTIVLKEGKYYENRPTQQKRGPRFPSFEASHAMYFDDAYSKSQICLSCHQWEENGIMILDEYNQWGGSAQAAELKQCQFCHMPDFKGITAFSAFTREDVKAHSFLGTQPTRPKDMDFLKGALELSAEGKRDAKNPKQVKVVVKVTNKSAAHALPAGFSWREIDLIIRVRNLEKKVYWEQQEIFKRTLGDGTGKPILEDWYAKEVLSDTRLKPNETRTFEYIVDVSEAPEGERLFVTAQVFFIRQPRAVYEITKEAYRKPVRLLDTFKEIE